MARRSLFSTIGRGRQRPVDPISIVYRLVLMLVLPVCCLALLLFAGEQLQASTYPSTSSGEFFTTAMAQGDLLRSTIDQQRGVGNIMQDDDDPGDRDQDLYDEEYEGEVLRRPSNEQGMGGWLIRSDRGISYWAYADDETEFRPVMAAVGQRVRIRGEWVWYMGVYWFVAERIEIRDHGQGQEDKLRHSALGACGWSRHLGAPNRLDADR